MFILESHMFPRIKSYLKVSENHLMESLPEAPPPGNQNHCPAKTLLIGRPILVNRHCMFQQFEHVYCNRSLCLLGSLIEGVLLLFLLPQYELLRQGRQLGRRGNTPGHEVEPNRGKIVPNRPRGQLLAQEKVGEVHQVFRGGRERKGGAKRQLGCLIMTDSCRITCLCVPSDGACKTGLALSLSTGEAPAGRAEGCNLSRGCGIGEYFAGAVGAGKETFDSKDLRLVRSKRKPLRLPLLITILSFSDKGNEARLIFKSMRGSGN